MPYGPLYAKQVHRIHFRKGMKNLMITSLRGKVVFNRKIHPFNSEKLPFLFINTVTISIDTRNSCGIQLRESLVLLWPQKDVIRQPYGVLGRTS